MKFVIPIPLGLYLFFCFIVLVISAKIFIIVAAISFIYILIFKTKILLRVLWFFFIMGIPELAIKYWPITIVFVILCILGHFVLKENKEVENAPLKIISNNKEID